MGLLDEIDAQTFRSSVFIGADEEAYHASKDILGLLGVEDAQNGAYFSRENSDRIYLPEGLVLTALYNRPNLLRVAAAKLGLTSTAPAPIFDAAKIERDEIIQPLATIEASERCVFEINAGVEDVSENAEKYVRDIATTLRGNGVRLLNHDPENIGVVQDPEEDEPLILVRNRRAVIAKDIEKAQSAPVRQTRIFGSLTEAFADAIASASNEQVMKVRRECARINALSTEDPQRILSAYWTNENTMRRTLRQQEIFAAARNYARQLNAA